MMPANWRLAGSRRIVFVWLLLAGGSPLQAGVIQGIAVENISGLPLARARLSLSRLEGNRLVPVATATASRNGQFVFDALPEGYYQLSGVRAGFAETRFGQRRNNAPGAPVFVPRDSSQFVELRLKRLGAITGRTLDENSVGLPGVSVSAYTASLPMRRVSSATSDDRGVYRIIGLLPGRYLVRTGPARLEDGVELLPTYHPFTSVALRDARQAVVDLDAATTDIDIQPAFGSLFSLFVSVTGCLGMAEVTVSTDTGRREAKAPCNFGAVEIPGLAPGEYEVLAEGDIAEKQKGAALVANYFSSRREMGLALRPLLDVTMRLEGGGGLSPREAGVLVRRRDPAGEGSARPWTSEREPLAPGFWQITAHPPPSHYLANFRHEGGYRRQLRDPHPEWFEISLDYPVRATLSLSGQPARIAGRVTLGSKPAVAAPVYLLPLTPETRRRMNGLRTTAADVNGNYHFEGLAPGSYLLLSSFDFAEVSEETLTAARAQRITLQEGGTAAQDLELHQAQ